MPTGEYCWKKEISNIIVYFSDFHLCFTVASLILDLLSTSSQVTIEWCLNNGNKQQEVR